MNIKLQKIVLRMSKLAIYAMIVCPSIIMAMAAKSDAQRKYLNDIEVELSKTGEPRTLFEVFSEIESETEFIFAYSRNQLSKKEVVLKGGKWNLKELLGEVSLQAHVSIKRFNETISLKPVDTSSVFPKLNDQIDFQKSVSGKVIDDASEPIIGATVLLKGTSTGTVTDVEGKFQINVPDDNSTLIISFVGYKTAEVAVGDKTNLGDIPMETDYSQLNEVVVVGYGTQKKAALSGSVVTLDSKKLVETPVSNLSNAIAGRLAGVIVNSPGGEPGADDAQILIRGKATLGNTGALIVIDGIPDRGGFSRLNPQDIESFTVLKDASAAIYGARAANGVILITTKRGTSGKPVFSASTNVTFSQLATNPQKYQLDSWQTATVDKERIDNLGTGGATQYTDEQIELMRNGTQPLVYANTDWYEQMLKEWSTQTNHSLSVRGGSENIRYYVSGQLLKQEGIYKGGDFPYNQASVRANLDADLTKNLTLGVDFLNRRERRNYSQSGANNGQYLSTSRVLIAYFPNGLVGKGIQPGEFNFAEQNTSRGGYTDIDDNIINSKISLNYKLPVAGLSIAAYGAFDTWNESYKQFKNIWDEYIYDYTTDEYVKAVDNTERSLHQRKDNSLTNTYNVKLNYEKTFDAHYLEAFVAYEQSRNESDYISATRQGFASAVVDDLFAGATNTGFNNDGASFAFGRKNIFGRINYDYSEKYFATFSIRRDGSQNFPKNKRYGTFPALSVGWALSNEAFLSDVKPINYLKLRASWGKMGNDNVAPFQYLSSYEFTNYDDYCCGVLAGYDYGNGTWPGIYESVIANPGITWETATTTNVGLEGTLFENLINVELDYFTSKREGILIKRNASVPEYTGLVLPDENLGIVKNHGFEAQVGVQNQITQDLSYSINGNVSYAQNEVVFYDEPASIEAWQKYEGRPIDSYLLWDAVGIYQTQDEIDGTPHGDGIGPGSLQLKDVNQDGVINDQDRIRINNSNLPTTMYGVTLGLDYKNFNVSVLLQGQAGGNVLAYDWYLNREIFENRWQKEGDNQYPRVETGVGQGGQNPNSTYWLRSTDFLRFKNFNVSYNLPSQILDPIGLSSLQVYVRGYNLFLIYDKLDGNYRDPESGVADYGSIPTQRNLQLGLNLSF